jgi:hypothetical protein
MAPADLGETAEDELDDQDDDDQEDEDERAGHTLRWVRYVMPVMVEVDCDTDEIASVVTLPGEVRLDRDDMMNLCIYDEAFRRRADDEQHQAHALYVSEPEWQYPDIGREELIRFFTLTRKDLGFVDNLERGGGRGPAARLGLAVPGHPPRPPGQAAHRRPARPARTGPVADAQGVSGGALVALAARIPRNAAHARARPVANTAKARPAPVTVLAGLGPVARFTRRKPPPRAQERGRRSGG